jgi:hypothetical protein
MFNYSSFTVFSAIFNAFSFLQSTGAETRNGCTYNPIR